MRFSTTTDAAQAATDLGTAHALTGRRFSNAWEVFEALADQGLTPSPYAADSLYTRYRRALFRQTQSAI